MGSFAHLNVINSSSHAASQKYWLKEEHSVNDLINLTNASLK